MPHPSSLEPRGARVAPAALSLAALHHWPVVARAACAQLGALPVSLAFAESLPFAGVLLLQGVVAAGLAVLLRLPWWWWPMELAFAPALAAALALPVASGWFLAAFLALAAVYGNPGRTRVPLYLSGRAVWQALADLVPPTGRVLDLGSGLGGPLLHLARHHPGLRGVGIEAAPLPWLISRLRAMGHTRLSFVRGSFWEEDLGAYDFVFAYLSPAVMPRLWRKVQAEMEPGSVFVSVEFPVPGVEPHAVIHTGGRQRLYLWRF